mmetsp:Transcript_22251/g.33756  ORF Transcript_22251/g.33756 Transcript_22251/m.33756 type:complete len:335 (-) Transcript_22251:520-1524(-)
MSDLLVIAHVTAALSMFGSLWIVIEILTDHTKRSACCHRILLGLSVFDFFSSFWFFMANWAQPRVNKDSFSRYEGYGTVTTCQMSGFFIYLGVLTIPSYNAALSWYYYLGICCQWREEQSKEQFERYVHFLIVPAALIIASIPPFLGLYNPFYFYCFATSATIFHGGQAVFPTFYLISVICSILVNFYAMVFIVLYSRKTFKKSDCYEFQPQENEQNSNNNWSQSLVSLVRKRTKTKTSISRRSRRRQRLASSIVTTAILYTIPFLFTWFIPVVWYLCVYISFHTTFKILTYDSNLIAPMETYLAIFLPLQGFVNFLVYKRSKFQKCGGRVPLL